MNSFPFTFSFASKENRKRKRKTRITTDVDLKSIKSYCNYLAVVVFQFDETAKNHDNFQ